MNKPLMQVTTRQIAVGQGGLMHCEIVTMFGAIDHRLSVVFDCGSFNREALQEGIESIEADVVDILFISHLDADLDDAHFSGTEVWS